MADVGRHPLPDVLNADGGYRLARSPSDVTLLEVVEAVEGTIRGKAPPPENRKHDPNCKPANNEPRYNKLEGICKSAAEHPRKTIKKVKLSDLIEE